MMIRLLRYILLPLTVLYGIIVWLRNRLYDWHILPSKSFSIPTIVIGNLAVGGTGKSPMTELLINHLRTKYKIAILSRGYGRKTKGFHYVQTDSTATEVGDEPLQFKNKFPDITVAVCEDRCTGITKLQNDHQLIILDDAYQHRKLRPLINILLFDYASFSHPMYVFPSGNFRDLLIETKRADIITVTKCPLYMDNKEKEYIIRKLRRYNPTALITFTTIIYYTPIDSKEVRHDLRELDIMLVTGIANPRPLLQHLKQCTNLARHVSFADHYNYRMEDITNIIKTYEKITSDHKAVLTTEKDFQRLKLFKNEFSTIPLLYIPIGIKFLFPQDESILCNKLLEKLQINVNQH